MQETDLILLSHRQLDAVRKDHVILEAAFQAHEEPSLHGTHLRAETQAECRVLIAFKALLIGNATIPVIVLEERFTAHLATDRILLPAVTDLPEELQRIRVGQLPLIAHRGIERTVEEEAAIQGKSI